MAGVVRLVGCGRLNARPLLLFRLLVEAAAAPCPNSVLVTGGLLSVLTFTSFPNKKVGAAAVLDAPIENSEPAAFEVLEFSAFWNRFVEAAGSAGLLFVRLASALIGSVAGFDSALLLVKGVWKLNLGNELSFAGGKILELASGLPNTNAVAGTLLAALVLSALVLSALVTVLLRNEANSFLVGAVVDGSRLNLKPPLDEVPKLRPDGLLSSFGSVGRVGFGFSQQTHFFSVDLLLTRQDVQFQLSFGGRN